jgi:putative hemolysin
MKQLIAVCLLILIVFLAGCTANNANVACTMEAKLCPDGTAVGRVPPTCDFSACPSNASMANPASVYCEGHNGTLQIVTADDGSQSGICTLPSGTKCDEWAYFRGECTDTVACTQDAKICPDGTAVGRVPPGCEFAACPDGSHVCTKAQKNAEACTLDYNPVCGWYNSSIQCIKYPCAGNYGNSCQACADAKVASWTQGECPPKI